MLCWLGDNPTSVPLSWTSCLCHVGREIAPLQFLCLGLPTCVLSDWLCASEVGKACIKHCSTVQYVSSEVSNVYLCVCLFWFCFLFVCFVFFGGGGGGALGCAESKIKDLSCCVSC